MWMEKKVVLKCEKNDQKFPIEVLNQWDITELEIIGGCFTYFPEDITILKHLKKLTVVSTKIKTIPREVFELPELSYLNLKNNQIVELPKLQTKSNLTTLILGRNKLETIDDLLPHISEVRTLDLSGNAFETLSQRFMLLKDLQRLNLDSNQLRSLPVWIKDIGELAHLSVERNPFSLNEKARIERDLGISLTTTLD